MKTLAAAIAAAAMLGTTSAALPSSITAGEFVARVVAENKPIYRDRLTLDVLRDPERNDITLIVEVSATLMPNDWSTLATSTLGAPFTGPGYWDGDSATPGARYVTIRDTVPIAPGLRRFVRLRVVH